jgi:hypothetical protein
VATNYRVAVAFDTCFAPNSKPLPPPGLSRAISLGDVQDKRCLDLLDFELRHLSLSPVPSTDSYLESNRLGFQPLSTKKGPSATLLFTIWFGDLAYVLQLQLQLQGRPESVEVEVGMFECRTN